MFDIIFKIFYPLIMTLIPTVIMINISSYKFEKKGLIVFIIINYFELAFIHNNNKDNIAIIAVILSIFLYLYIVYKNAYRAIGVALLTCIILALSDSTVGIIEVYILNISRSTALSSLKIYFVTGIAILLVCYIISRIIREAYDKIFLEDTGIRIYFKENSIGMFYIASSLLMLTVQIIMYKNLVKTISMINVIINVMIILGFIFMSALMIHSSSKSIRNRLQQEYRELEYKQLQEYTSKIENMDNDLRKFKHDYANILQALGGYVESEDFNGLKEFYHKDLLKDSRKIVGRDRNLSMLKHIKIIPLKALISSKIIEAHKYGIKAKIEIIDDIYELEISNIDICRITGVFLDNAIEAANLCGKKNIRIAIIKNDDSIVFVISNSCLQDTPPVYKIYKDNFSTKGEGRGIGLKAVRHIIDEKYDNVILNTKLKDCVFKQELIIYEKKV